MMQFICRKKKLMLMLLISLNLNHQLLLICSWHYSGLNKYCVSYHFVQVDSYNCNFV